MTLLDIHFDFSAVGSSSLIISVVGYFVVFAALVLLYAVFFFVPKLINYNFKKKFTKVNESKELITAAEEDEEEVLTDEVNAAVSAALYLYFDQIHDEEDRTLTIKRVTNIYSPWSSKIYQVRNNFNRM